MIAGVFTLASCSKNNVPQGNTSIQPLIDSKQYVFRAQTANPMTGRSIQLSYGYDLVIQEKRLVATLPYFGRAYNPDPNFAGIRFTSNNFLYTRSMNSNGGWEIVIKPEDVAEIQEMRLSISAEGYATLFINSTSRQPISFYGIIAGTS